MHKITSKFALLSVFDKKGIAEFAKVLVSLGYQIISTEGTAKILIENKIPVIPIQTVTGNPESFDGRIKTISFQIESGILFYRKNPKHVREAKSLNIKPIDIVVCNLYPFEQAVGKAKVTNAEVIENIDVGGPTMIRAAAKNFENVLVITNPGDYKMISLLLNSNKVNRKIRKDLAGKAFSHLSFYDSQIAHYLKKDFFPEEITLAGRRGINLRYGENPHQKAAVYFTPNTNSPLQKLQRQWGRDLSLVNITDINAGLETVRMFEEPAAVVIKHNSPCGIAIGKTSNIALKRAIQADPESAFGGTVVLNISMDLKTAKEIGKFKDQKKSNIDIIGVPAIKQNALHYLKKMRKSMGIYTFGNIKSLPLSGTNLKYPNIKYIDGGFILQTPDSNIEKGFKDWKIVTKKKPTKKELLQMKIAWKFISRIRSNAVIVVDKNLPMTRGIGSGQTSRVRSTQIALNQARGFAKNGILASDSFFPFDDSIRLAGKLGISAIVQQGGSINDKLSIETANRLGISMTFTNRRAFWH